MPGDEAEPQAVGALGEGTRRSVVPSVSPGVEEADLDPVGVPGVDGDVGAALDAG